MIISLITMLLATILNSCTRCNTVGGVVSDVTENTMTIVTEEDAKVTFSIRNVRVRCADELRKGSLVEVAYSDDISDGFGNARVVESADCSEKE